MAGAEAEGRRESEAEAEDEWASEAEGVPLTFVNDASDRALREVNSPIAIRYNSEWSVYE